MCHVPAAFSRFELLILWLCQRRSQREFIQTLFDVAIDHAKIFHMSKCEAYGQWRTQNFRMGGVEVPQSPKGEGFVPFQKCSKFSIIFLTLNFSTEFLSPPGWGGAGAIPRNTPGRLTP